MFYLIVIIIGMERITHRQPRVPFPLCFKQFCSYGMILPLLMLLDLQGSSVRNSDERREKETERMTQRGRERERERGRKTDRGRERESDTDFSAK